MQRKLQIAGILVISLITQATGQNISLSLSDAIRGGLKNNQEVQNAGIEEQKSQKQLMEQQSKLYPQIDAYSDFYYYYGIPRQVIPGEILGQSGDIPVEFGTKYDWSSGLKATQVLYNQSYFTSLKIARQKTGIEQLNLQQRKEELAYQISQVYYICLATNRQKKHLSVTIENMEQLLRISELQQHNGVLLKVDHDQILVDQNNLQTEMDNLDQLYEQQVNLLKYLIGIESDLTIELTDSLTMSPGINNQPEPGWEDRTEIKKLNNQMEIAILSLKKEKQEYFPVLSGFAQYYYQGQRDQLDFFDGGDNRFFKTGFVGMSLSIPIFDGFGKKAKIQQQKLSLQQLQNTSAQALNFFSKAYKDALLQYEKNHTTVTRQKENIRIAEENYRVASLGYRQQTISLSGLLRAQNSLTEACLSYDNALLQLKNAELDLSKSKGELLKGIN